MRRKNKIVKVSAFAVAAAIFFSLAGLAACSSKGETNYTAEFTWTGIRATATLTPDGGGDSIVLEADVQKRTTPPTCTEKGVIEYTAKVTYAGKDYTDVKSVESDALGHDYGEWMPSGNGDGMHKKVCANDASHILTDDCTYKTVITVTPGESTKGHGKSSCTVCGDIQGESDLPELSSDDYDTTAGDGYTEYSITIQGVEYKFKTMSVVLEAEKAQRIKSSYPTGTNNFVRFNNKGSLEITFIAEDELSDVTLYIASQRGSDEIADKTVFELYDIKLNDTALEADSVTETASISPWSTPVSMKACIVSLKKGVNHISIADKGTANGARPDFVRMDYVADAAVELASTKYTATFGNEATLNLAGGEDVTSGNDGIYTGDAANGYINPYTESLFGEKKSVRLNTTDTVEFTFEVDKDVDAYLTVTNELRRLSDESINVFNLYKLFVNGTEIKVTDAGAISDSAMTSSVAYGEWHILPMALLSFKAGTTYTVKLQARQNQHIDYIEFAYVGDAQFDPVING